jgi:hypothetical protein
MIMEDSEMMQQHFDYIKSNLEFEISELKDENREMQKFFTTLAVPIIKKVNRNIEKQLRRFPREACQFWDDSKLNFFEEVCVMRQEGSMDDYLIVEDTIESCCESVYSELNNQENFIINHQTNSLHQYFPEFIKDEFLQYANKYVNKRIIDSIDRRSYIY